MSGGPTTYAFVTIYRDVVKERPASEAEWIRKDVEGGSSPCRQLKALSLPKKSFVDSLPSSVLFICFLFFFFSPSHLPVLPSYPLLVHPRPLTFHPSISSLFDLPRTSRSQQISHLFRAHRKPSLRYTSSQWRT